MNAMTPFAFEDHLVRVVMIDGEPWFVAKDVAAALHIAWQGEKTIARLPERWKGVGNFPTPSGEQSHTLIAEPGVYKLAFRSSKPEADRFTDWLAEEVLPTIRRTGRYALPDADETTSPPQQRRVLMPGDAGYDGAVRLVREARLCRGAEAAMALWRMLGLPWTPELDRAAAGDDDPCGIGAWLAERVVDAPGIVTAAAVLMRDYAAWCARKGVVPASAKGLGAELASRGYRRHKASVIYWHGLRLAAAAPLQPEGPAT